jgi:hypothetical protein
LSLLEAVGSVEQHHDGKYRVTVGTKSEAVNPPKHKDIDIRSSISAGCSRALAIEPSWTNSRPRAKRPRRTSDEVFPR